MKKLLDEIKQFKGNVVSIGVQEKNILKNLMNNKNISIFELERNLSRKLFSKKNRIKTKNGKSVKIKKFRKIFKKKSIEYLIINLDNLYDYYKYIASNSIYICNTKIYIYGKSEYITAESVAKKFKRYKTKIECIQDGENYLTIIDCSEAKYSYIKEKFYLIIDTFINLGDMITYFLTS